MSGWLVYHPERKRRDFLLSQGKITVHFDETKHNQDPYVWNRNFLHTFCHISQIKKPKKGDIVFWVSGEKNKFPDFTKLLCDLVFQVDEVCVWLDNNYISINDRIVDSTNSYIDHYRWFCDHLYKRRKRYTLKASQNGSFQSQDGEGNLIDIVPILNSYGYTLSMLRTEMKCPFRGSRPLEIDNSIASGIYNDISLKAKVKLEGMLLETIRERKEFSKSR